MPAPVLGWPSTHVPTGYLPILVSLDFCVNISPKKSLHPSPIPPDCVEFSALEFAGPPVRRLEMPWPYSCVMIWLSKSPSRFGDVELKIYICIRPLVPSGGVEKLALLVPLPSCASAIT